MSGSVNIPSYIKDNNYRYKMPKMVIKQESRLNGVKSNIVNLDDVAKALRVPPEALIKYWCAELGASKEKKTILKGMHNYDSLLKVLDKFIEKYLLCQKCTIPETTMFVKQKQLQAKCRSCGASQILDSNHRAGSYLMKSVPQNMSEIETSKEPNIKDIEEDQKKEEASEPQMMEEVKEEALNINSEEIVETINSISQMIKDKVSKQEIMEFLKNSQISKQFTSEFKYYIMICGIFNLERNIVKHWKTYEDMFVTLVSGDGKQGIKHFMQAIILFFIRKYPEMSQYAPTFMKVLYDQEIFTEDFLLKWHAKKRKLDKTCKLYDRKAEQSFRDLINDFIKWLQEAEEEEDDDEEGEEVKEEKKKDGKKKEAESPGIDEKKKKQMELIEKQMKEQNKMFEAKKEEAVKKSTEVEQVGERINVMNIAVEDNFDIDDI